MVKPSWKDTFLGGTTPTAQKNEVATCQIMYYDNENKFMINKSVNIFYTHFLFKIDALLKEVGLLLDISETLFDNLSTDLREFLIS